MATPERWSRTVGAHRGARVRIFERTPGGVLYVAAWVPGLGQSRISLGHRDRDRAVQQASALLAARTAPAEPPPQVARPSAELTLGELFRQYVTRGQYLPDGSLKTVAYLEHLQSAARHLARHFGEDFPVATLRPDRVQIYVQLRRGGHISGRPVRTNCIQREMAMLKAALNWACTQYDGETPLLERNPLQQLRVPRERDPKRPLLSEGDIDRLLSVAGQVSPILPTMIVLARNTGRRISSILGLKWDDVDLDQGTIRWRAELDKKRKTWLAPMSTRARDALIAFRAASSVIGPALLFPHPKSAKAHQPITRHLAAYYLKSAFELAHLEQPDGSLWHVFRRVWATERKHLPPRDVAAAGGWSDITTLLTVYQQADEETMREVVDYVKPRSPRLPWQQSKVLRSR